MNSGHKNHRVKAIIFGLAVILFIYITLESSVGIFNKIPSPRTYFQVAGTLKVAEFVANVPGINEVQSIRAVISKERIFRVDLHIDKVFNQSDFQVAKQEVVWKKTSALGPPEEVVGLFFSYDQDYGVILDRGHIYRVYRKRQGKYEIDYLIRKTPQLTNKISLLIQKIDKSVIETLEANKGFED